MSFCFTVDVFKQITIPSVFIGDKAAKILMEEFSLEKGGHIVILPDFSLPLEYYLIPFLIIVGICLILIAVFMVRISSGLIRCHCGV
uniref:Uncharacterized protein n=1 Tax=Callorhinchus milii TaxID=7868 RepID=A0A4W3ITY8_CALMI